MADPNLLTNQDFLGKCYDTVTLDPLDLNKSAKYQNAIEINAGRRGSPLSCNLESGEMPA